MHGLVILDEEDQVIRPAILWNDGRTYEECDYLNQCDRKGKAFRIYSEYFLYRIYRTEDSVGERTRNRRILHGSRKIMLPKDYIAYRLTGVHCTDVSDASGMLIFDVKNRCWSKEMCGDLRSQREAACKGL